MGGVFSKEIKGPPIGCFWTREGGQGLQSAIWIFTDDYNWDCDCRLIGLCPPAPPPPPSLTEFVWSNTSSALYADSVADCPLARGFPRPANYSYSDPTWHPRWVSREAAWHPDTRPLAEFQPEPNPRRHPNWDDKRQLSSSSNTEYQKTVMRVVEWLPAKKLSALQRVFGTEVPVVQSSYDGPSEENDASDIEHRFVLSVLLAEPDKHAQSIVALLPQPALQTLFYCSNVAVQRGLDEIRQMTQINSGKQVRRGKLITKLDDNIDEAQYALSLGQRFLGFTSALSPQVSSAADISGTLHQRYYSQDTHLDKTCASFYQSAVSNLKAPSDERYVANFPEAMYSFNKATLSQATNPLLASIRSDNKIVGHRLNWTEPHMISTFGDALPAITVAINFLTLSLHAGSLGLLGSG